MTIEQQAAIYGLSRQTYQLRLKNWLEVEIDGLKWLVNPNQMMKLNEEAKND